MSKVKKLPKPKLQVSLQEMEKMEIDELFNDAVNFFNMGDTDSMYTSLHMFHMVIEKNPDYIAKRNKNYLYLSDGDNAYYYLAILYQQNMDDLDSAINYFSKSVELCPDDYDSLFLRGACWSDKNEHEKALDDFKMIKKLGGYDVNYDVDSAIKESEKKLNL